MIENTTIRTPAELEQQAEAGDAMAQFELACHYAYFENAERNLDLASMWLIKAAEQGLTDGEFAMGCRHYFHREERVVRAESEWIREYAVEAYIGARVCEEASPVALGFCLAAEKYPNIEVAISWFGKAAAKGNAEAQFFLARCYLREGSSHNFKLASDWLAKALDQGWNLPTSFLATENLFVDLNDQDFLLLYEQICLANELIRKKKQTQSKQSQSFGEFSAEGRFEKNYSEQRLNELGARAFEIYFNDARFTQNEQLISIWQTALAESGLAEAQYKVALYLLTNKNATNCYIPGFLLDIYGESICGDIEFILKNTEYLNIQLGTVWMVLAAYEGKHPDAQDWLTKEFLAVVFPALKGKQNVEEYYKFAFEWCNENAKSANTMDVNLALGILHFTGAGVGEPNTVKALEFFSRAKNYVGMELEDDIFGMYADKAWFMEGICRQFFCHGNGLEEKPRVPWYRILSFFLDNLSPEHKERVILSTLNVQLLIQCGDIELAKEKIEDWFVDKNIYLSYVDQAEKRIAAEKAIEEKEREMLSFFTHTMRNALATAPEALRQAIQLLGSEVYEQDSNHYKAINKMTALFSSLSLTDSLIDTFKQSITDPQEFKKAWDADNVGEATPKWVIATALRQALNRILFMSDTAQLRVLLDTQDVGRIKATRKSFIDKVLPLNLDENSENQFFDWIGQQTPRIEVVIDDSNNVHFGASQTRFSLLFAITSELVLNALKYWDGQDSIRINWQRTENGDYLFCVTNHCQASASSRLAGTHKGLAFIKRLIELLGPQAQLSCEVNEQVFAANLKLNKSLFDGAT